MRDGYTTDCRFNRDNDTVERVRWDLVPEDAPTLPFPSVILNSRMEFDCEWGEYPVGEVYGSPFRYHKKPAPPGLGNRVCGTEEDFALGGQYRPDLPPAAYAANGYLACCQGAKVDAGGAAASGLALYRVLPPLAYAGGAGASGRAEYSVQLPIDPTAGGVEVGGEAGDDWLNPWGARGGVEVGGEAGDQWDDGHGDGGGVQIGGAVGDVFDPGAAARGGVMIGGRAGDRYTPGRTEGGGVEVGGEAGDDWLGPHAAHGGVEVGGEVGDEWESPHGAHGGVEVGGEAGDVFTPGIAPGSSCETAGVLHAGDSVRIDGGPSPEQWWNLSTGAAGTCHFSITENIANLTWYLYSGACGDLTLLALGGAPICYEYTETGVASTYLRIEFTFTPGYRITLDTGTCP